MHLDLYAGDGADQAAEVNRLITLGATRVDCGKVLLVPGQNCRMGLGQSHNQAVNGRTAARPASKLSGSTSKSDRDFFFDNADSEESVGVGTPTGSPPQGLEENRSWNDRRPQLAGVKSADCGQSTCGTSSQKANPPLSRMSTVSQPVADGGP